MAKITRLTPLQAAISRESGANTQQNQRALGKFASFSANC